MTNSDHTKKLRVYVAGPYRGGGSWGENLNAAINAGEQLLQAGHIPFIPHTHTALWDLVHPKDSETWLDIDFEWLDQCDALVRLDGQSQGADAEVQYADEHNIPFYFGVDSFLTTESDQ